MQTYQNPYPTAQAMQAFQTGNFQQMQQAQNNPPPLTGKWITDAQSITPNDVPMDGSIAWFPKQIYRRFKHGLGELTAR